MSSQQSTTDPFAPRRRGVGVGLSLLVVGAAAASLAMGAVAIPVADVVDVVLHRLGLLEPAPPGPAEAVVWNIRLPRILLGFVTGASLGVAGLVLQGAYRNPLADPQLLGIGPGAAIGATIGSIAGGTEGAIAGGVAAGVVSGIIVRRLGRRPSVDSTRFILSGVALGAALSAWVGFLVFAADRSRVPPIEFWLLGGLSGSTWRVVWTTGAIAVVAIIGFRLFWRTLDLLSLGETEARYLGVDVAFTQTVLAATVGALVGGAVGAAGVIGFVGLLVPHVVVRLAGPGHRHGIPFAVLGGGAMVIAADLVARTAASPVEIPVGLITAAVGGPFFLWLLGRSFRD